VRLGVGGVWGGGGTWRVGMARRGLVEGVRFMVRKDSMGKSFAVRRRSIERGTIVGRRTNEGALLL